MLKLPILVLAGALCVLCAKADALRVTTSADRSSGTYRYFESDRNLRGDSEHFIRSALIVRTGSRTSELPEGKGFSPSELVRNEKPGDVTESTDESINETLRGAWSARTVSSSDYIWHGVNRAPVTVPADVTPVPEPETLGLIAAALATIVLIRGKRLA